MNKTIIHCKTTAAMFMAGAKQTIPELRVASIKGNMRYIWRAIQCAENIDELRVLEGNIFGNAFGGDKTKASAIRIRIEDANMTAGPEVMTPHRKLPGYSGNGRSFSAPAIKEGSNFDIVFTSFIDEKSHIDYVRLFAITCLLYGFGRRSRKGFGTVVITGIDGAGDMVDYSFDGAVDNLNMLSKFGAKYSPASSTEITVSRGHCANYPYIEKIKIAGSQQFSDTAPIIGQIGMSAHLFSREQFLGTLKPRFASSVLLSTTLWDNKYRCIVTQLNCTKAFDPSKRDNFYLELDGRV